MKQWIVLVSMFVLAIRVPLCSAGKGDVAAGKQVYVKKCATCHGAAGEGKEAIAKMMKAEMHHLGSKEVQSKTDAELHKIIVRGSGKMKPVAGLTDAEVANLIAYVRSLAKK